MEQTLLVSLLSDLGSMGFILWLTHRLTTETIPRLARQFEVATEKQRMDFKDILAQQRADHLVALERTDRLHEAHVTRIVDAVDRLKEKIGDD